jgi:raffinose/stachyose/melibiose transport system permease protein
MTATPAGHAGGRRWVPYALLAAPAAVYGAFVLYPLATTVRLSFYEWNGIGTPVFTGLGNFARLVTGGRFLPALSHNVVFLVFYTVFPVALALLLAALLVQDKPVRGLSLYRIGLFVPQVMPMVVVGVIWRWIYSPVNGVLAAAVEALGGEAAPYLGQVSTALPAIGVVASWVQYGFALVLFLAGVQRIDRSLYEAAAVDGASRWNKLRHITLPGLRSEIVVATVVSLIAAVRVFDLVFVMTRGGPSDSTNVVAFEIYRSAFLQREVGLAAAGATVMVAIILALSLVVIRYGEAED